MSNSIFFNPNRIIVKAIAAIVCLCFLWQDVVWAAPAPLRCRAGGSDFLRQRQIYVEGEEGQAASAGLTKTDELTEGLGSEELTKQLRAAELFAESLIEQLKDNPAALGALSEDMRRPFIAVINNGLTSSNDTLQRRTATLLDRCLKHMPLLFTVSDLSIFLGASDACAANVIKEAIRRKNNYLLRKAAFSRGLGGVVVNSLRKAYKSRHDMADDGWLRDTYEEMANERECFLGYAQNAEGILSNTTRRGIDIRLNWLKKELRTSMGINYRKKTDVRKCMFGSVVVYHIEPPYGGNVTIFAYGEGEGRRYTVVDTGIGAYYYELIDYLATPLYDDSGVLIKEAIYPHRIERILITHYDVDHAGCAALFYEDYGIPILCHPNHEAVRKNRVPGNPAAEAFSKFMKLYAIMMEPSDGAVREFKKTGRTQKISDKTFNVIGEDISAGSLCLRPLENTGAMGTHTADFTYFAIFKDGGLIGIVCGEAMPVPERIASRVLSPRDTYLDNIVYLNGGIKNVNANTIQFIAELRAIRKDPAIGYVFPGHGGPQVRSSYGTLIPVSVFAPPGEIPPTAAAATSGGTATAGMAGMPGRRMDSVSAGAGGENLWKTLSTIAVVPLSLYAGYRLFQCHSVYIKLFSIALPILSLVSIVFYMINKFTKKDKKTTPTEPVQPKTTQGKEVQPGSFKRALGAEYFRRPPDDNTDDNSTSTNAVGEARLPDSAAWPTCVEDLSLVLEAIKEAEDRVTDKRLVHIIIKRLEGLQRKVPRGDIDYNRLVEQLHTVMGFLKKVHLTEAQRKLEQIIKQLEASVSVEAKQETEKEREKKKRRPRLTKPVSEDERFLMAFARRDWVGVKKERREKIELLRRAESLLLGERPQFSPDEFPEIFYTLGLLALHNEDVWKARRYFERQLKVEETVDTYLYLAIVYAQQGEIEKAYGCRTNAVRLTSDIGMAVSQHALLMISQGMLYRHQKKWQDSETCYLGLLRLFIQHPQTRKEDCSAQECVDLWYQGKRNPRLAGSHSLFRNSVVGLVLAYKTQANELLEQSSVDEAMGLLTKARDLCLYLAEKSGEREIKKHARALTSTVKRLSKRENPFGRCFRTQSRGRPQGKAGFVLPILLVALGVILASPLLIFALPWLLNHFHLWGGMGGLGVFALAPLEILPENLCLVFLTGLAMVGMCAEGLPPPGTPPLESPLGKHVLMLKAIEEATALRDALRKKAGDSVSVEEIFRIQEELRNINALGQILYEGGDIEDRIVVFIVPGIAQGQKVGIKELDELIGFQLTAQLLEINSQILVRLMLRQGLIDSERRLLYHSYKEGEFRIRRAFRVGRELSEEQLKEELTAVCRELVTIVSAILRGDEEIICQEFAEEPKLRKNVLDFIAMLKGKGIPEQFLGNGNKPLYEIHFGVGTVRARGLADGVTPSEGQLFLARLSADFKAHIAAHMAMQGSGPFFNFQRYTEAIRNILFLRRLLMAYGIVDMKTKVLKRAHSVGLRRRLEWGDLARQERDIFPEERIYQRAQEYLGYVKIHDYVKKWGLDFSQARVYAEQIRQAAANLEKLKAKAKDGIVILDEQDAAILEQARRFIMYDVRNPQLMSNTAFLSRIPSMIRQGRKLLFFAIDGKGIGISITSALERAAQRVEVALADDTKDLEDIYGIWSTAIDKVVEKLVVMQNTVAEVCRRFTEGGIRVHIGGDEITGVVEGDILPEEFISRMKDAVRKKTGLELRICASALVGKYLEKFEEYDEVLAQRLSFCEMMTNLDEGLEQAKQIEKEPGFENAVLLHGEDKGELKWQERLRLRDVLKNAWQTLSFPFFMLGFACVLLRELLLLSWPVAAAIFTVFVLFTLIFYTIDFGRSVWKMGKEREGVYRDVLEKRVVVQRRAFLGIFLGISSFWGLRYYTVVGEWFKRLKVKITPPPESHACKGVDEWLSVGGIPPHRRNPEKKGTTGVNPRGSTAAKGVSVSGAQGQVKQDAERSITFHQANTQVQIELEANYEIAGMVIDVYGPTAAKDPRGVRAAAGGVRNSKSDTAIMLAFLTVMTKELKRFEYAVDVLEFYELALVYYIQKRTQGKTVLITGTMNKESKEVRKIEAFLKAMGYKEVIKAPELTDEEIKLFYKNVDLVIRRGFDGRYSLVAFSADMIPKVVSESIKPQDLPNAVFECL